MFIIEGLTDNGWSFEARHDNRDNASGMPAPKATPRAAPFV